MLVNTEKRSTQREIMDDLSLEGELLRDTLDQLAKVNKWLGGYKPTMGALKRLTKLIPKGQRITVVDIGCGGGDMLRVIADYGRKKNRKFNLIGIDANEFTINYARKLSSEFPEIKYYSQNVFSHEFLDLKYDIVLLNLILHHFKEDDILKLMDTVCSNAKLGVIVNDLQRSALAFYLFKLLCLAISNPMAREDGLISILRGFKRKDLIALSKKLNLENYVIQWKWAFRYLWLIDKR